MNGNPRNAILANVRKIVVKVGTAVLTGSDGRLDTTLIHTLSDQVHALRARGGTVVLVTSGAIGAGMAQLGMKDRPTELPMLQAAAAVGQSKLMSLYDEAFAVHGYHAAQMLLTRADFEDRTRYVNARNTLWALLEMQAVPVINENDTVAVDELKFGDNDIISALVTHLLEADLLILLTTVDGLYRDLEEEKATGEPLDIVNHLDDQILGMASDEKSRLGSGGMQSKLLAVKRALETGQPAVIAHGRAPNVLPRIMDGEKVGTLFVPSAPRMKSWKRWLGFAARPRGRIRVDDGAYAALSQRGKSLLASGILDVQGQFKRGDVVILESPSGHAFARGLSNYSSEEIEAIKGRRTQDFAEVLGEPRPEEVIHRNNLVILHADSP